MKIVVLDGYSVNPGDLSWNELEKLGSLTVYDRTDYNDIVQRAENADIILTNKVVIDRKVMERLPSLKYIGVLATGYNVVDIETAKEKGIVVCNIPAYSTNSVAQMVFAHLLAITNRVEHYSDECRNGKWSNSPDFCYWNTPLSELAGKKFGVIGLGNTGTATARIAIAFGMQVYAFTSKNQLQIGRDIRKSTIEEIFSECDIISLNCPLNESTKELVNKERLDLVKPDAIIINTGRGGLVNEKDVADALNDGRLAAFGADVAVTEPIPHDSPLLDARNVFLTPHIAWATKEARTRLMDICTDNIKAFIDGHPQNIVNK